MDVPARQGELVDPVGITQGQVCFVVACMSVIRECSGRSVRLVNIVVSPVCRGKALI